MKFLGGNMSLEQTGSANQNPNPVDSGIIKEEIITDKNVSVKALLEVKKRNEALSAELKKYQEKDKKVLEQANEYKSLYELSQKENEDKEAKLMAYRAKIQEGYINSSLNKKLSELGFNEDFKDLAHKAIDKSSIKFDEDTNTVLGMDMAVKSFHEKYGKSDMFKKGSINVNQGAGTIPENLGNRDLSKLKLDEKLALLSKMK
jgi:hypothetical protein